MHVLSRERMNVGQIDRPGGGVADVRQQIARFDRLVTKELRQCARRGGFDVVELSQSQSVVVGETPPVGVDVRLATPLAEFRPSQVKVRGLGAVHAQ